MPSHRERHEIPESLFVIQLQSLKLQNQLFFAASLRQLFLPEFVFLQFVDQQCLDLLSRIRPTNSCCTYDS